ncbi:MAG: LysM peptidoglycan-binding domain-containing protein, partial [Planctomycetales bacterium]
NVDPMKADAAPVGVDPMKAAPNNHPARPIPTSSPASVGQATDNQPPIPPRDPKQGARGAAAALAAAEFAAAKREIQAALAAGRFVEALRKSSTWYHWDGPSRVPPQEREWHQGLLSQLAGTVVYSRRHFLEEPYQVQHGDTLRQIAQRFQVPSRLLANINGISDAGPLRLGQSLKVIRGPLDAYLSLNQSRLALRLGDLYAGVFDIGIGRDFNAPPGESVVQLKLRNPAYRGLDATIGADAPNNPLGEHWIDLGGPYGIHGANGEFTAGRSAARGYIRMRNQDVAQLYDILSIGSRVVIGNHRPDEVAPGVAERTGSANPRPR